jgi:hypothetical protein
LEVGNSEEQQTALKGRLVRWPPTVRLWPKKV